MIRVLLGRIMRTIVDRNRHLRLHYASERLCRSVMPAKENHSSSDDKNDDRYERFLQLILEHEPSARSYLRGLLPSWDDVDEVIQEATLIAWRKFDEFEKGTSFGGWYLTIARFEALRYRRRAARSPLVFTAEVSELLERDSRSEDVSEVRLAQLESCLEKMEPNQKALLIQAHTPGVMIKDVSKQAGRTEQAFYKALQRWRRSLLECVSKAIALEGN